MNGSENSAGNPAPQGEYPDRSGTGAAGYGRPYGPSSRPAPPPAPERVRVWDPRAKSPVVASILSLMPGLGQIYVGYYQRGFVHILVTAGLIAFLNVGIPDAMMPMAGMFLAFFWMYNVIDAGRRASLYNQVLAGDETIEPPADFKEPSVGGSIAGGAVLVTVGFILLLHTLFDLSLIWLEDWWPVAPMLFGVYLLVKGVRERSAGPPVSGSGDPGDD